MLVWGTGLSALDLTESRIVADDPLESVPGGTYVRGMVWEGFTTDQLEQRLVACQMMMSRLTAEQMSILEVLDTRQVATGDGCRSLSEWVASRLDVSVETAKTLVRTMRRIGDRPDLAEALAAGEATLDRVEAVSRIPEKLGLLAHLDVAEVRYRAAQHVRISAETEAGNASERFLVLQPCLDESWWRIWGGLDGYAGAIVDKALTEAADALPPLPDGIRGDSSWRKATALYQMAAGEDPPPAQVSLFVDTGLAVSSNGEAGVVLEAGPRVGPRALETVLCDAETEVTVIDGEGTPMRYGRRSRTIPPALRRYVIQRDGGMCGADSCVSRHRLQVHHKRPWSEGGATDPENLITLCWFHHQIVVHEWGYQIYQDPATGRIRFHRPARTPRHRHRPTRG